MSLFLLLNVFNLIIIFFFWIFNAILNRMFILFEYSAGKITNFNANGGSIFLDLGQILVYYFLFSGDVLNQVCISTEGNVSHPFSS